jgi:hypothetical protein
MIFEIGRVQMSVSVEGQTSCAGEGQSSPAPRQALSRVRLDERRARDLDKINVPRFGTDLASRLEAEDYLIRLCRHMRKLGIVRDHSYDIGLHTAVLHCLDAERRELAIIKANSEEIAA